MALDPVAVCALAVSIVVSIPTLAVSWRAMKASEGQHVLTGDQRDLAQQALKLHALEVEHGQHIALLQLQGQQAERRADAFQAHAQMCEELLQSMKQQLNAIQDKQRTG
jgi:hypothetical protein